MKSASPEPTDVIECAAPELKPCLMVKLMPAKNPYGVAGSRTICKATWSPTFRFWTKVKSIEIFPGENGGHRVAHNFRREAGKKVIRSDSRQITMLQVDLTMPAEGQLAACYVQVNG